MRRTYTRLIAGAAAVAAGALAAFALRGPSTTATAVAARNPAVEVRTVVVRRTIHIVKHEHPAGAGSLPGRSPTSASAGIARSRASGSHGSAPGAAVGGAVSTRTSGSHAAVGATRGTPVTTRTSTSHGSSSGGSGSPVATRTSASSGGSSGKPVATRTSGGHGGEGGDGGGGDN